MSEPVFVGTETFGPKRFVSNYYFECGKEEHDLNIEKVITNLEILDNDVRKRTFTYPCGCGVIRQLEAEGYEPKS